MVVEITETKKVALERRLEKSWSVFVTLDPRREGVVVPPWLRKDQTLTLQIGLNLPVQIRDLEIDDEGFRCTLSFSRSPYYCNIPWDAVFLMSDDEKSEDRAFWPDSAPEDLPRPRLQPVRRQPPRGRSTGETESRPSPDSQVRSVPSPDSKPRPSHLRLVK